MDDSTFLAHYGVTRAEAQDSDFLEHAGVKGMKWGHRKVDRPDGVSRGTNRTAAKDAKEFASAKVYYGEGAGTRRKLIKNTVEARKKRDPSYQKAFDHHLSNQNMDKRVSQAKSKRKRTDAVNKTTKTARGLAHISSGNTRYASAAAMGIAAAATYAHKTGLDRKILNGGVKLASTAFNSPAAKAAKEAFKGWRS